MAKPTIRVRTIPCIHSGEITIVLRDSVLMTSPSTFNAEPGLSGLAHLRNVATDGNESGFRFDTKQTEDFKTTLNVIHAGGPARSVACDHCRSSTARLQKRLISGAAPACVRAQSACSIN